MVGAPGTIVRKLRDVHQRRSHVLKELLLATYLQVLAIVNVFLHEGRNAFGSITGRTIDLLRKNIPRFTGSNRGCILCVVVPSLPTSDFVCALRNKSFSLTVETVLCTAILSFASLLLAHDRTKRVELMTMCFIEPHIVKEVSKQPLLFCHTAPTMSTNLCSS
jgi:hypothetical protein